MTTVLTNRNFAIIVVSVAVVVVIAFFVISGTPFKCALGFGEDRQVACETKTKISSTDVPNKKSDPNPSKSGTSDGKKVDTNSDGQEDAQVWNRDINNDGNIDAELWDTTIRIYDLIYIKM